MTCSEKPSDPTRLVVGSMLIYGIVNFAVINSAGPVPVDALGPVWGLLLPFLMTVIAWIFLAKTKEINGSWKTTAITASMCYGLMGLGTIYSIAMKWAGV